MAKDNGITLCMLVRNEADRLAQLLPNVAPFVDAMLIGDNASSDDSAAVAVRCGAHVIPICLNDDFASARNEILQHVETDWVLLMDADEALESTSLKKLREISQQQFCAVDFEHHHYSLSEQVLGFKRNRGAYPSYEQGLGYYASTCIRFFYHNQKIRFQGRIHELVEASVHESGLPVLRPGIVLHHYGHLDSKRRELRHAQYLPLSRLKAQEEPQNWKAWFELGLVELRAGSLSLAIAALEKAQRMHPEEALVMSNSAQALLLNREYQRAETELTAFLSRNPTASECHYSLASVYVQQSRYSEAAAILEPLQDGETGPERRLSQLVRIHISIGDLASAQSEIEQLELCQYPPLDLDVLRAEIALRRGNKAIGIHCFEEYLRKSELNSDMKENLLLRQKVERKLKSLQARQ